MALGGDPADSMDVDEIEKANSANRSKKASIKNVSKNVANGLISVKQEPEDPGDSPNLDAVAHDDAPAKLSMKPSTKKVSKNVASGNMIIVKQEPEGPCYSPNLDAVAHDETPAKLSMKPSTKKVSKKVASGNMIIVKQEPEDPSQDAMAHKEGKNPAGRRKRRRRRKPFNSQLPPPTYHDNEGKLHTKNEVVVLCDCLRKECNGCFSTCKKCGGKRCAFICQRGRMSVVTSVRDEGYSTLFNPYLDLRREL